MACAAGLAKRPPPRRLRKRLDGLRESLNETMEIKRLLCAAQEINQKSRDLEEFGLLSVSCVDVKKKLSEKGF